MSGKTLRAQVAYAGLPESLSTVQQVVGTKIRNAELVLSRYARARQRAGYDSASLLLANQNKLSALETRALKAQDRKTIFLIEARAAHLYWQAFRLICNLDDSWRRFYPHAKDSANVLLNSGYTILARKCREALIKAGLVVELGFYHGDNSGRALVYDFMEIFRVPAVDLVIIPIFTRRPRSGVASGSRAFGKTLALLNARYQWASRYRGRCEKLERILYLEAIKLRQAILTGQAWRPYQHPRSHHRACEQ